MVTMNEDTNDMQEEIDDQNFDTILFYESTKKSLMTSTNDTATIR